MSANAPLIRFQFAESNAFLTSNASTAQQPPELSASKVLSKKESLAFIVSFKAPLRIPSKSGVVLPSILPHISRGYFSIIGGIIVIQGYIGLEHSGERALSKAFTVHSHFAFYNSSLSTSIRS